MTVSLLRNGTDGHCHDPIISLEEVSFSYQNRPVIEKLSFDVLERDFVGLVGSNGAGKTTLLRMIVGLIKPTAGEIKLFGTPVSRFKDWERIGYVPQRNNFNPLFPATVREVVMSGLYGWKNRFRRMRKADMQQCEEAMRAMGIEALANRKIGQLSGGQQQRAFLARALVNHPDLMILDEPTVGIDIETQENFFQLVKHMHEHHQMTFLMVSHDREMLRSYLSAEPSYQAGGLRFYVKHSHEPDYCEIPNLSHAIAEQGSRS